MFFDCFEDAVCYMCGKGGVLEKTEKDGRETAFNEDSPIQPVNVQARLIFNKKKANYATIIPIKNIKHSNFQILLNRLSAKLADVHGKVLFL